MRPYLSRQLSKKRSAGEQRGAKAQSQPPVVSGLSRAHETMLLVAGASFLCYSKPVASESILGYKLKMFPTRAKADMLALLAGLFQRSFSDATTSIAAMEQPRIPPSKGRGEFTGRAYRRAHTDWKRSLKASRKTGKPFTAPTLRAELIDAAHVQAPRKAKSFDLWVMVQGVGKLYIPAKKHRAINRALAYPGATLCEQGEVFRKNGKWYCRVGVKVPLPETQPVNEWIGVDVGVRKAITCSDGYQGPDLRPILDKQQQRAADQARHLHDTEIDSLTSPRQAQAKEARALLSRAQKSGRGIALENPRSLPKWRQWSAKFFAKRILLLAPLAGVPVSLVRPAYTSLTCSRCGEVGQTFRSKTMFRCLRCRFTANADRNAALNIAYRAHRVSCGSHHSSFRRSLLGGGIVE